jgi:cytochrome c oxidase cbb3-type subunit I/II
MKIAARSLISFLFWPALALTSLPASAPEVEAQPSRQTLLLGQEIYQVNCAVCHGVEGDGNGPAASMFRIRPRDFRPGIFKFRSTPSGSLPTDDDLLRTVTQGLRWTGMIGRADLRDNDRRAVIQYIKTFSSRFTKEKTGKPVSVPPPPEKTQQILQEGKRLYAEVGCSACHGTAGRGDGPSAKGLKDDWGWPIWPSDLTWRPLKRGSDTAGVYLTLVTGVSGTPMPSYADSMDSRQLWALVYYLDTLVPQDHRLNPNQVLGEEQQGWMALRMGGMMGGMMGRGMMYRSR